MRISLCAKRFVNNDIQYNVLSIISAIHDLSAKVDFICFGEAFLQGFDCLSWNYDSDKNIAVRQNSKEIALICKAAKNNDVMVAFGYIEAADDKIYSSYLVISNKGEIVCNYRRVSEGWKVKRADAHYCEGKVFSTFETSGKTFAVALCGDLWYEENIELIATQKMDILLWPVYVDYTVERWETDEKLEYALQVNQIAADILLINSVCDGENTANGGTTHFKNGTIVSETLGGSETVLIVDI